MSNCRVDGDSGIANIRGADADLGILLRNVDLWRFLPWVLAIRRRLAWKDDNGQDVRPDRLGFGIIRDVLP